MNIEMFDCRISRRGKGVKGFIEAQTIGKPEVDDKGIAKSFDYSHLVDIDLSDLLVKAEELGNVNIIIARGIDLVLKSTAIRSQAATSMLQARIMQEGLARDKKEAKNVAASITSLRSQMSKLGIEPISIDLALENRKKVVDKLKASKEW